nr:hypothetical protein [uncultured Blautia sp.]
MRKITYETLSCTVKITKNFKVYTQVPCEYPKATIAYAAERFFANSVKFRESCTRESWELRFAKGKKNSKDFSYVIPAALMELPGSWVRMQGGINPEGVNIESVELFKVHPCFSEKFEKALEDASEKAAKAQESSKETPEEAAKRLFLEALKKTSRKAAIESAEKAAKKAKAEAEKTAKEGSKYVAAEDNRPTQQPQWVA